MIRKCIGCGVVLTQRHKIKYCSNKCHCRYKYEQFIEDWKNGLKSGTIGINVRTISGHLRRYLAEKYGEHCSECKWDKRHPITGRVTLEIDHIDGNAENNLESNLRLMCPNCHSLTPYFRNLNKGNGRKWRIEKYRKDASVNSPNSIPF
jgi:DNA-directed RNA polymerase subunit L